MLRSGKNFGAFILTHGRPNKVKTYDTLKRCGYTGPIWLIVDNEDATVDEYRKVYGDDKVIVFDKAAVAKTFDEADTTDDRRAVVYARNACWDIARELGLDYYAQLDDDYTMFKYKYARGGRYVYTHIRRLDDVIDALLGWLDESGAATVAMSQGGDHIGGINGNFKTNFVKRKAMNTFFLRTDRPFSFPGRINDDVNAYVVHGSRGRLFFTTMALECMQTQTQTSSGGMTDVYRESGTYAKSFYSVMMAPSCVVVAKMPGIGIRIHHVISWDNAVPKIIHERYRKPSTLNS